jgi:hypothetical protein
MYLCIKGNGTIVKQLKTVILQIQALHSLFPARIIAESKLSKISPFEDTYKQAYS